MNFPANITVCSLHTLNMRLKMEERLRTTHYDKRDYFSSPTVHFPLYVATLKQQSAYGVYISQLIGYSSACSSVFMYLDVLGGGSVVVWVYLS